MMGAGLGERETVDLLLRLPRTQRTHNQPQPLAPPQRNPQHPKKTTPQHTHTQTVVDGGEVMLVPANVMALWLAKFEAKFRRDPDFLTRRQEQI